MRAFAEQIDLDFKAEVLPPTASYVDSLVCFYGWKEAEAIEDMEWTLLEVAGLFRRFGGTRDALPLPVEFEDVKVAVDERSERAPFGVLGREEEIAQIVHRYLMGQGDDYDLITSY